MSDERLVEADALLEKGDPRGELIIVQSELERGGFDRARGIALRERERELMATHHREWAPDDSIVRDLIFRCGVVVGGTVNAADFVTREPEIAARYPFFTYLKIRGLESDSNFVGYSPPRDVDVDSICTQVERVLASGRITSLDLTEARVSWHMTYGDRQIVEFVNVTNEVVAWLAASGRLARLAGFFVNLANEKTIATVLGQTAMFHELGFSRVWMRRPALDAMAVTKQRPRKLVLEASWPHDAAVFEDIVRAPFFGEVVDLTTQYPPRFFVNATLPSLRVLRFTSSKGLTTVAVRELLASPVGRQLEALDLGDYEVNAPPVIRRKDWDGVLLHWLREDVG